MKRVFDLLLALAIAVPAALACAVIALLLRVSGTRSPFFVQVRVGRDGQPFKLVKFRTMSSECPDLPSHEAPVQLITPLGKRLRRLKLDELPQLWNVLRGDMSFVGPRPCLFSQTELIEERRKQGVLQLVPGITGVSQIIGLDMSQPVELAKYDATYVRPWSIRTDLQILAATFLGSGRGDAVGAGTRV